MSYLTSLLLVSVPVSMGGFIFYHFIFFLDLNISGEKTVCVCLLTLVSEGGGGRGRGNRGSRCRDGTLANRLLHDTPPFHLVHHIFYIETTGVKKMQDETRWNTGKKRGGKNWNYVGNKEEKDTQAGRRVWRRMWGWWEGGWGRRNISEAFYWINITAQPSAW